MNKYCLSCGKPLQEGEMDYHASCRKRLSPFLEEGAFSEEWIDERIEKKETVPGVQKKMSVSFFPLGRRKKTLYPEEAIIKFPSLDFPYLTEMENLSMNLADAYRIPTAEHALIRKDGQYFYLTKRMDRDAGKRIPMEDFCQLSKRLTEDKYKGSYESFGDLLDHDSSRPLMDKAELLYRLLFCFLIGNNDMHRKNFSLLYQEGEYRLSPAYDLLNVMLIYPKDPEEMALTVNGKKKNLHKKDFLSLAESLHLPQKVYFSFVRRLKDGMPQAMELIQNSLLSEERKGSFLLMLQERIARLEGGQ